jgi:hypothetical protein
LKEVRLRKDLIQLENRKKISNLIQTNQKEEMDQRDKLNKRFKMRKITMKKRIRITRTKMEMMNFDTI